MNKTPRLQSTADLGKLMAQHYIDAHQQAGEGKFVIWNAIGVPLQILKGFDVVALVPESHSAMTAAKSAGVMQAQKAEKAGYSIDLCSYARIDIGTVLDGGNGSPSMGLPKPDLLISNNNNCSLLVKWFEVHHRGMKVPHFSLDVPYAYEKQSERDLDYIASQYRDMIAVLEELTGQQCDMDKIEQALINSVECLKHWKRFLGFATHRPSGITAFDSFAYMAPFVLPYRGSAELVHYYRQLADEVEERVRQGIYPVPNERYRLLWDNIAPWHQLRNLSQKFAERGVSLNCASYTSCIGSVEGECELYIPSKNDPIRNLARVVNGTVCPSGMKLRQQELSQMIDFYEADGAIFASNSSCKVYSLMQYDLRRNIMQKHGIPAIIIDNDMADARKFNEANALTRIDALLEMIDSSRSGPSVQNL